MFLSVDIPTCQLPGEFILYFLYELSFLFFLFFLFSHLKFKKACFYTCSKLNNKENPESRELKNVGSTLNMPFLNCRIEGPDEGSCWCHEDIHPQLCILVSVIETWSPETKGMSQYEQALGWTSRIYYTSLFTSAL